jgi:hypothetical protein
MAILRLGSDAWYDAEEETAMIELTEQQRREVKEANGDAVRAFDPESKQEYVLLRAEAYQRLRELAEAEVVDPSLYEFEEIEPTRP